jgi:uncharacterized damage-inducible protein DinB
MDRTGLPLAEIATDWLSYQEQLVTALAPLSAEQLALRPAAHLWSVGMIAAHIVAARAHWFHGWMGEGGAEFDKLPYWDDEPDPHTAAEIVAKLALTWGMIETALGSWTAEDLEQSYRSPYRKDRPPRTRKWIAWHVIEHDLHHGGEISLTLGMHGVSTTDV